MKRLVLAMCLLVVFGFVSGLAFAEEISTKWSIGVTGGGVFPRDSASDTGFSVGGNIAYGINDYVAVGLESSYEQYKVKDSGIDFGDCWGVPLMADLYVRYPFKIGEEGNLLVPYFVGGIGATFWNFDEKAGIKLDMKTAFTGKTGLGTDYFVTKNVSLGVEGGYLWSESDATASAAGITISDKIKLDQWYVNGALKYHF